MTVLSTFLSNQDKVDYTSYFDADKIAVYSTTTDALGAPIGLSFPIGAGVGLPSTTNYIANLSNAYGRRALMTMSWSIDNVNFLPMGTPIYYYNATYLSFMYRAFVFAGSSDSTISFVCQTQYTASQTIYIQFAADSPL